MKRIFSGLKFMISGFFLDKKIFANIFLLSLILVGILGGTKIRSKNSVTVFYSATVFSAM